MTELGPNLVTTCTFKGDKEYITKMRVTGTRGGPQRSLELIVTDKYTAEDWRSSYDTAYIENLTQKTGNYKQFDVFVTMLQSGLLKTSDCISLDLLTFEDLESLRARRRDSSSSSSLNCKSSNRRYLIVTYTVEFDRKASVEANRTFPNTATPLRIHYPLPLEYCGPPEPAVLQMTIRRLEAEIERLHTTGVSREIQRRVDQLTAANQQLIEENRKLAHGGKGQRHLVGAIKTLETSVAKERASFRAQIQKLQTENASLVTRIRQLTENSRQRTQEPSPIIRKQPTPPGSSQSCRTHLIRRGRSPSPSFSGRFKVSSLSPASSTGSLKTQDSPRTRATKSYHFGAKEIDFGNLESRIQTLQKMLKDGINLN